MDALLTTECDESGAVTLVIVEFGASHLDQTKVVKLASVVCDLVLLELMEMRGPRTWILGKLPLTFLEYGA